MKTNKMLILSLIALMMCAMISIAFAEPLESESNEPSSTAEQINIVNPEAEDGGESSYIAFDSLLKNRKFIVNLMEDLSGGFVSTYEIDDKVNNGYIAENDNEKTAVSEGLKQLFANSASTQSELVALYIGTRNHGSVGVKILTVVLCVIIALMAALIYLMHINLNKEKKQVQQLKKNENQEKYGKPQNKSEDVKRLSDEDIKQSAIYRKCYEQGQLYYDNYHDALEKIEQLKAELNLQKQVKTETTNDKSKFSLRNNSSSKTDTKVKSEGLLKLCDLKMVNGRVQIVEGDNIYADMSDSESIKVYASENAYIRAVKSALSIYFEFSGSGSKVKTVQPCILKKTIYDYTVEKKGKVKLF